MAGPGRGAGLREGFARADAQPSGAVGQICEDCPDNWVEAGARDQETGAPLTGLGYRVYDLASGDRLASGVLDERGEGPRHAIPEENRQLYVVYGTAAAMDEAEGRIEEVRRERALELNARPDWNGIPAGLDEGGFNDAFDARAHELGDRPRTNPGLLEGAWRGAKRIYEHAASPLDWDAAEREFYLDERARGFDEYQLATGAREASRWESFFGGGGQGVSFGFGDEAMAGFDAMITSRTYEEAVAARRQIMDAQRIANPGTYLGGEVAGAIPTIFVPVGGAAANAARAGRGGAGAIRAGAGTGAATGGLSGAGHDEGGVLDRLDGAALGAATGGAAGAVMAGAGVLVARGVAKTRIWGRFARPRPLTKTDFPEIETRVSQKQNRHIQERPEYRGGGVMRSRDDAQQVLDAWHAESLEILGRNGQGFPVVRSANVTGTNINVDAGFPNQPTNVFMIKGTRSPSVVPMNPNWTP